jgi:nitrite reductase/ring-hydroxylating ferredoxin subunit/uncharacterized membrane protein
MRSFANFKGHPSHPALIPFPFAFLTGAFVAHSVGVVFNQPSFWTTGGYLTIAGVAMALVAAVPGFLDYVYTVPPESSGKRRATKHLLAMLTVVVLFGVSLAFRGGSNTVAPTLVLVLQGIGAALLMVGAWLGGTLVSRNQISVDHRYANAGKWNEARLKTSGASAVVVAREDELQVDQMKLLHVDGHRIVLARTDSGYAAFDDRCTHRGASLADGVLICGTVQCPWHGSQFDARTGAVKAGPAKSGIGVYDVEVREREVLLHVAARRTGARPSARAESAPGPVAR